MLHYLRGFFTRNPSSLPKTAAVEDLKYRKKERCYGLQSSYFSNKRYGYFFCVAFLSGFTVAIIQIKGSHYPRHKTKPCQNFPILRRAQTFPYPSLGQEVKENQDNSSHSLTPTHYIAPPCPETEALPGIRGVGLLRGQDS